MKAGVKKVDTMGSGFFCNLSIKSRPHPFLIKEKILFPAKFDRDKSRLG
jgi:hypothetical protein